MTPKIPTTLIQNIKITHGSDGELWLQRLPTLLDDLCGHWKVGLTGSFDDLTYNFVAPVKMENGDSAVLKIGPHAKNISKQARALEIFNGAGAVKLLAFDQERGALLIEQAFRAEKINSSDFCEVAKSLSQPRESSHSKFFPHISIWGLGFEKFTRTKTKESLLAREVGLTDHLAWQADKIFKDLIKTSAEETLLHGDLHHSNILRRENGGLVAIDPKGVWGEPCYEAGAFLRNPMPKLLESDDLQSELNSRIAVIDSELDFDSQRIRDWAYAQSILAAIWSVGDGPEQVQRWLTVAKALEA